MKVLVTGGKGRLASRLVSTTTVEFVKPSREELNLESFDSIDKFLSLHNIDGLVLNAFQYLPGEVTIENIRNINQEFIKATQVNLLGTLYLYLKLKDKLKFLIFLSTGLDPKREINHIYYRNNKAFVSDLLERISYKDNNVKTVFLHPGHMHDDYTFNQSALQLTKVIEKIDSFENLGTYGIFNKDKMEATKLANIKSYNTIGIVHL